MTKDIMIYLDGSKVSYRCEGDGTGHCGCNVFRRVEEWKNKFRCNGCGTVWVTDGAAVPDLPPPDSDRDPQPARFSEGA